MNTTVNQEQWWQALLGRGISGGWTVVSRVNLAEHGSTGGFFSVCFRVKNADGQEAFLKIIDVLKALQRYTGQKPVAQVLAELGESHLFEVEVGSGFFSVKTLEWIGAG
ncbi:MAG: hypothetical protein O3A92_11515 [Verrucomicrobia bacterium]|nr:hypothetical protein [Verrucomicrobiota bacterium]